MNIDTKLPAFRSFMSENKLNNSGVKTTIDQSAVSAGEQANVDLNLNAEDAKNGNDKSKKKKKDTTETSKNYKSENNNPHKSDSEVKNLNMKLLNLL